MPQRIEPMRGVGARPGKKTLAGVMGVAAAAALTAGLATWEGDRNTGYIPVPGDVPTACRGITGPGIVVGRHYTDAECETLNERGAIAHIEPVLACTPGLRDHPNQLAAAGMLAYNVGTAAYCRSTVARRFNAGDLRGACNDFMAWTRAGGRVLQGLVNRRNYERALCLRGL